MATLSWTVGEVRITRIEETVGPLGVSDLFPNATTEAVEAHRPWLAPHFLDAEGCFRMSYHSLIVEADDLRILVDTCFGEHKVEEYAAIYPPGRPGERYFASLDAAGFTPEDIDIVLCTHLHFDHVGWNTRWSDGELVPTFPNARYLFGREEWEHWDAAEPELVASTIDLAVRPLVESGQAQLVETDHRISASVWLIPTPGHAPAHVAVRISSGGADMLLAGDSVLTPVQLAEPQWCGVGDYDRAQSEATRRQLIEEYADTGTVMMGAHFPPPCAGRIVRTPEGVRFVIT